MKLLVERKALGGRFSSSEPVVIVLGSSEELSRYVSRAGNVLCVFGWEPVNAARQFELREDTVEMVKLYTYKYKRKHEWLGGPSGVNCDQAVALIKKCTFLVTDRMGYKVLEVLEK